MMMVVVRLMIAHVALDVVTYKPLQAPTIYAN